MVVLIFSTSFPCHGNRTGNSVLSTAPFSMISRISYILILCSWIIMKEYDTIGYEY